MLRRNFLERHTKSKSSYGASYQAKKFLRSIISRRKVPTEHHTVQKSGQQNCSTTGCTACSLTLSRHGAVVTPYAVLPSPHALVCLPAFWSRRIIYSLSWSLRRRLPSRCCRSRRSLELGADGILLLRRPSGRSGRSCVVLQHERSAFLEQCAERGDVGYTSRGSRHNGREAVWQKSLCAGASPHAEQSAMRIRNG